MMTECNQARPSLTAMSSLATERLMLAEKLIKADIHNGIITERNLESFENLHEVTDPNCYVSDYDEIISATEDELLAEYEVEDWINYWQTLIDTLDSWLSNHMQGNASSYLSNTTLIKRFG